MSLPDELPYDPEDYQYALRSTAARMPMIPDDSLSNELVREINDCLSTWDNDHADFGFNPIPTLNKICEIIEKATEEFLKKDPDPMDDRHPYRTHPRSAFGNVLKVLFRNDDFMHALVVSYILGRDNSELSIVACRLLLGCVPGLDSNVVFSEPDDFVPTLYRWAMDSSNEILQAYSMGLLAAALEVQEYAGKYRADNSKLIPIALRRLTELNTKMKEEREAKNPKREQAYTSFAHLMNEDESSNSNEGAAKKGDDKTNGTTTAAADAEQPGTSVDEPVPSTSAVKLRNNSRIRSRPGGGGEEESPPKKKRRTKDRNAVPSSPQRYPSFSSLMNLDNSNSKWDILQPFIIGTHKIYPLSLSMYQRLIFQYLTAIGEYQDLLSMAYEGNAMDLILDSIDAENSTDVRLMFDALKYLTSLLVHRKFALEFVARDGVKILLKVPRNSLASVGVVTCFYYLSYNEDVMEKLCQLEEKLVAEIVKYTLYCLEHSHESGMSSACMFFTHALYYRIILDLFDQMDGPRKLHNYISTLNLLQEPRRSDLSEEQVHTSCQCVRNACSTFKSYLSVQLFLKLDYVRRTIGAKHLFASCPFPFSMQFDLPNYKCMKVNDDYLIDGMRVLANVFRIAPVSWKPVDDLLRLGVFITLFNVIVQVKEWNQTVGVNELMQNAVESIMLGTCLQKVQMEACEWHKYGEGDTNGIAILLDLAHQDDEEVNIRAAALQSLINCICVAPEVFKTNNNRSNEHLNSIERKEHRRGVKSAWLDNLEKLWSTVRHSNGIMALNDLVKTPTTACEVDKIRTLGCKALSGLARSPEVQQIMSKLPLIANNEIQGLMRAPAVQDKRVEHAQFCAEATNLIEAVTQSSIRDRIPNPKELTQEKLWKTWVVANTKINYNEKELLQLIHEHLLRNNLTSTASLLRREADLPDIPASRLSVTPSKLKPMPQARGALGEHPFPQRMSRTFDCTSAMVRRSVQNCSTTAVPFATPSPIRWKATKSNSSSAVSRKLHLSPVKPQAPTLTDSNPAIKPCKALDDIIVEYLRGQHSVCSNPVTTCPPFSLFYQHKCPEPKSTSYISPNIARRFATRDFHSMKDRRLCAAQDERYVFGRFRYLRTIYEQEECYTACAFSCDDVHLIVGLFSGELHWMNIETGLDEGFTNCHHSSIQHIEPSMDGGFMLTSSAFIRPLSALWKMGERMELMHSFHDDYTVKFTNIGIEKVIGTNRGKATIYDTETCRVLNVFASQETGEPSRLSRNFASFSPDDKLVFNDGYLYDVRDPKKVLHAFDKLSATNFGTFHPHGNEIIINSEVWDVRTYRLLKMVPVLDQCMVNFNSTGNIMYATGSSDQERTETTSAMTTSFKTIDTSDYSVITTYDTRRPILTLACDHSDKFVAVIEKLRQGNDYINRDESDIKIFEVGTRKDADDADEGDEDDEDNPDEDGSDRSETDSDDLTSFGESSDGDMIRRDFIDVINREARNQYSGSDSDRSYGDSASEDGSSSWETDSGRGNQDQEDNALEEQVHEEADAVANAGGGHQEEDDQDDTPDYNEHESTSSTALNPNLRRRN